MNDQTTAARLADELDQLRGRLMRRDLGAQVVLIGMIERSRDELRRLDAAASRDAKDAARYRWLRDRSMENGKGPDPFCAFWAGEQYETISEAELDEAIDAALSNASAGDA